MTAKIHLRIDHELVNAILARRKALGIAMRGEGFRVSQGNDPGRVVE